MADFLVRTVIYLKVSFTGTGTKKFMRIICLDGNFREGSFLNISLNKKAHGVAVFGKTVSDLGNEMLTKTVDATMDWATEEFTNLSYEEFSGALRKQGWVESIKD
jgi:hypothetical protein